MTEPSTESAAPTPARSWVWRSTPDSVEAGTFSVLACVETVVAVGIYFWIALQLADLPYWWTSILVAPLLLMRSEQSVGLGVAWMKSYWEKLRSEGSRGGGRAITGRPDIWLAIGLWIAVSIVLSNSLVNGHEGFAGSWRGMVVVAVVVLGVGTLAALSALIGAVLILPGIWLRTLAYRFAATMRYPLAGLQSLPSNWWRTMFVIDACHPPELIPRNPVDELATRNLLTTAFSPTVGAFARFAISISVVSLIVPALFYRLVIRSTCWFHLLLFYLLFRKDNEPADRPAEKLDRLVGNPLNWARLILALVTAGGCVATAASHDLGAILGRAADPGRISILEALVVLNWSAVRPWQWLAMTGALFTVLAWVTAFSLRIDLRHADIPANAETAKWRAWAIEYLQRAATIAGVIWILLLVAHVMVTQPLGDWLPSATRKRLARFFDV